MYKIAKEQGIDVSQKQVREFLKSQDTYTKIFPKGGQFERKKFRPTIVGRLGEQLQMDLVDMGQERANDNDGNRYIITAIEVLSRYAFTLYQKGKSGRDTVVSDRKILDEFKEHFGNDPDLVQFDEGPEFLNPEVKRLLADGEIHYFSTLVRRTGYHPSRNKNRDGERRMIWGTYTLFQRKAATVERLNRTIKAMMWKYFLQNNTHQWIHILDDITHNYNNSVNRVLKWNQIKLMKTMLTKYGLLLRRI